MSPEGGQDAPTVRGPSPLSSGPVPLGLGAASAWAVAILVGTLFFGFGLSAIASRVAEVTVPPGALAFGSASIIPAPDWSLTAQSGASVELSHDGVWIEYISLPADGSSAAARVLDLQAQLQQANPQLTVASQPRAFDTPTQADGQLVAMAGTRQTAIVASVVDGLQAVDVKSLGESTQFGEVISDIESMLRSIRILEPGRA